MLAWSDDDDNAGHGRRWPTSGAFDVPVWGLGGGRRQQQPPLHHREGKLPSVWPGLHQAPAHREVL